MDCGTGAYGLASVSRDTFSMPEGLPTFQSSELRVLDMEKGDWRRRPTKVGLEDGRVLSFLACERDLDNGSREASDVGVSVGRIRTRLERLQSETDDSEEQEVCGVVLDCSPFGSGATLKDDGVEEADGQEQRIAGLLLSLVSRE